MNIKKIKFIFVFLIAFVLVAILTTLIYPNIEFKRNGKFYACRFTDDFTEFEENPSYNELYFYNKQNDISLKNFQVKNFLCFYVFSFDYIEGDFRKTQFKLEEKFIQHWLQNAVIKENSSNIDISQIIKNKTAIVGNKRYSGNEYDKCITYVLYKKWEELYVFESEGLTVIQVGSPDELPKYIAYK